MPGNINRQPIPCPYCDGTNLFTVTCIVGPHHSRTGCSDCGRHLWFNPAPWSTERARQFAMPFGKHRGELLGELAQNPSGRDYLRWVAANVEGNAGRAAGIVLAHLNPKGGRA